MSMPVCSEGGGRRIRLTSVRVCPAPKGETPPIPFAHPLPFRHRLTPLLPAALAVRAQGRVLLHRQRGLGRGPKKPSPCRPAAHTRFCGPLFKNIKGSSKFRDSPEPTTTRGAHVPRQSTTLSPPHWVRAVERARSRKGEKGQKGGERQEQESRGAGSGQDRERKMREQKDRRQTGEGVREQRGVTKRHFKGEKAPAEFECLSGLGRSGR